MTRKAVVGIKPEDLIEPSEAARILGVGAARVRQLVLQGILPAAVTLASTRRLFLRRDVERLAARREARSAV